MSESDDDMSEISQASSQPVNIGVDNYPRTPIAAFRRGLPQVPSPPSRQGSAAASPRRILRAVYPSSGTDFTDIDSVLDADEDSRISGSSSDLFSVGRTRSDGSVRGPSSNRRRSPQKPQPIELSRMFRADNPMFRTASKDNLAELAEIDTTGPVPTVNRGIFESPPRNATGRASSSSAPHPFPMVAAEQARFLAERRNYNRANTPPQTPIIPSTPAAPRKREANDMDEDEGLDGGTKSKKGKSKRKTKRKAMKKKKRKTLKKKKSLKKKRRLSKKKTFKKRKH